MAKAQMSSVDATMGENSNDLERFRYPWIDLYLAENFIWIGSLTVAPVEAGVGSVMATAPAKLTDTTLSVAVSVALAEVTFLIDWF